MDRRGENYQDRESERRRRVERYADLPTKTREWLDNLRPQDIEDYEAALKLYRDSQTIKRFWKWAALIIISGFAFATQLGEYIVKAFALIRGKP